MTRRALVGALLMMAGAAHNQAQPARVFTARLSPVPIDVSMQATIAGSGSVTATLAGNTLSIEGTFQGLRSAATVARLHRGYRGIRGPSFAQLEVAGATQGTIRGSIALTPAQADELARGLVYIQLHSDKAPEGNLWGWLLPSEGRPK